MVCDPLSSAAIEVGARACPGAPAARGWAGVRGGSTGAACATEISEPAITAPVTTSAPTGTAHRARLDSFGTNVMRSSAIRAYLSGNHGPAEGAREVSQASFR